MDKKETILAIDDNNVNLMMLSAMLSQEYDVATLYDSGEAVATIELSKPSLVLLDISMPGKDGLQICREIKANPATEDIPIIIVSGRRESQDIVTGLEAGADDYICKPFSTQELKLRIKRRIEAAKQKIKIDSAIISATIAAEERERTNIAQELHDGMGATLSSINIYLNMILSGNTDIDETFRTIRLTKELVGQAIENVKEIANNLHPVILTRFGLVATIAGMIEAMEESRIIKFGFHHQNYTDIADKNLELTLYRIINELITNTLKHAQAKNASITLERRPQAISLAYADNGIGLPDSASTTGHAGMGISNIQSRVKGFNGKCEIASTSGNGINVNIEIPYNGI